MIFVIPLKILVFHKIFGNLWFFLVFVGNQANSRNFMLRLIILAYLGFRW